MEALCVVLLGLALIILSRIGLLPMNRIRTMEDNLGFSHIRGDSRRRRETINRLRKSRKIGRTPPAYPNGWFCLTESRELRAGNIVRVSALGQHFAVFRGDETGEVFVVDAYCPHLGADITAGGKVVGDCVECPFHHWRFEGQSGDCVHGPSSEKTRKLASLKHWPSLETNGVILVWFHTEGASPQWEPFPLEAVNAGQWVYQGRNEYHINCHIQDISENGADPAHLDAVHSMPIFCGGEPSSLTSWMAAFAWHQWGLQWKAMEAPDEHCAELELHHDLRLWGKWSLFALDVKAHQLGPALVHLHFESPWMGRGVMVQYVLPLEPMLQKVVHLFYTEASWWSIYAKMVLWGESILLERDITVWNSKSYANHPVAGSEDGGLLLRHRRWYSRFYSGQGSSLFPASAKGNPFDW